MCVCMRARSFRSSLTLCDPMDCRLPDFCLWNSPGKNTGVDCHSLFQGIFQHRDQIHNLHVSWASLVAQLVKNPPAMQETWVRSLRWKVPWRRERLPTPVFWPREFHELYSHGVTGSDTTE